MKKKKIATKTIVKPKSSDAPDYQIKIRVIGVGGGGGNAIGRMHRNPELKAIEFVAINTDAQDLEKSDVRRKLHIGKTLTRGLGTGMNPELGKQAAEENRLDIVEAVKGADLIFITAGLGGGTGSGAAPIIAEAAKEQGALTVAIVTRPFTFEGSQRNRVADEAISRLREKVDALIIVPNDRIFSVIKKDTPILKAFERIDDILRDAIQGIAELIAAAGIINVDFADIKAIMKDAGSALVGVGQASGLNRAATVSHQALNSPLLEFSVDGARGVLFGISGGRDVKMTEINEIAKAITANIDPAAKVIFGAYHDRKLKKGAIKLTLIATGFNSTMIKSSSGDMSPMTNLFNTSSKDAEVTTLKETTIPLFNEKKGKHDKKEEAKQKAAEREEKKRSDFWDVPAFLRKKKKP